jgi:hypothetical protein
MKEGEDYILTEDPESTDGTGWAVIFERGVYEKVVARYTDIEILDQGTKLQFQIQPLFVPEGAGDVTSMEFHDHAADVLVEIIKKEHEEKAMIYLNKKTGERVIY